MAQTARSIALLLASALVVVAAPEVASGAAAADETEERAPGPRAKGKKLAWKSGDGLRYEYFIPKSYDSKRGATLLFILHGSNLDRRWGFANHESGKFRPDDIIVCPDGTTPNGQGGFNFRQADRDANRLKAIHSDFIKNFKIRTAYLYGHSQGAFFAHFYAGLNADKVRGVLAHAGGVWVGTRTGKKHYHQAISIMHGSADPVVAYSMALESARFYREAGYPAVHLRTLADWNHWPNQDQAAQQLAWIEGMESFEPERIIKAFEALVDWKGERDEVALYGVATRLAGMKAGVKREAKQRAAKVADGVNALAGRHAAAIEKGMGRSRKSVRLEKKAWIGHLHLFLQEFDGLPACDEFRKKWKKRLENHLHEARRSADEYHRYRNQDVPRAFVAGVDIVAKAFLAEGYLDKGLLDNLAAWQKDAQTLGISKSQTRYYDQTVPVFVAAKELGKAAFSRIE